MKKPVRCPTCGISPQFEFQPAAVCGWQMRCDCAKPRKICTGGSAENKALANTIWQDDVRLQTARRLLAGLPLYTSFRKFVWLNSPANQHYLFQYPWPPAFGTWLLENLAQLNQPMKARVIETLARQI